MVAEAWNRDRELSVYHLVHCSSLELVLGTVSPVGGGVEVGHTVGAGVEVGHTAGAGVAVGHTAGAGVEVGHTAGAGVEVGHID